MMNNLSSIAKMSSFLFLPDIKSTVKQDDHVAPLDQPLQMIDNWHEMSAATLHILLIV